MIRDNFSLETLQKWMQDALVFPRQASAEEIEQIVESTPQLTGVQRLAIYQRSYYLRIVKCMREQFPALCHALGEDLFNDFAQQYLQACPSDSYTLYELGRRFPEYLESTRPDREETEETRESWIDFMVDLARFERQLFVMFDAPGHEGQPLADESVPDNRLRLQPCLTLRDYRFPVAWYYHEVKRGATPVFPPRERSFVVLVRRDYVIHTLPLSATRHSFLTALQNGRSIEEALVSAAEALAMPFQSVHESWTAPGGARQRWIAAGFFVAADSPR